jgi:hypothetical protein
VLVGTGIGWGELAQRTLSCPRTLRMLRRPGANPRLSTAARVAAALDLPIERLWTLRDGRG